MEERGIGDVSWRLELTEEDLVVGSDAHQAELKRCLRESISYVALVSSFVAGSSVKTLLPFLNEALDRGVLIDVIWGELPESLHEKEQSVGFELLKKLELETARSETKDKLNVARQPADSHAKILLYDTHEGVRVCLGSFNWLAAMAPAQKGSNTIRVKLTDPAGKPIAGAQVTVTFFMEAMPTMNKPEMKTVIKGADKGGGMYEGKGDLGSGGMWQVTVTAQQHGQIIATKKLTVKATGVV